MSLLVCGFSPPCMHILSCMLNDSFDHGAPDSNGAADMLFAVHVAYPNLIS